MEQLIYPLSLDAAAAPPLSEDAAASLLAEVNLEHLAERYGVHRRVQWNEELSLGEQQRLGMARLMFQKPAYAILDECTSGVTTDMEARFTDILKRLGCTCITISHRPALVAFHDLVLALDGEGGWQLLPGQRNRRGGGSGESSGVDGENAGLRSGANGAGEFNGAGAGGKRGADARLVNAAMSGAAGAR